MLAGDRHVAVVTRDNIYVWDPRSRVQGCGLKKLDIPEISADSYRMKLTTRASEPTGEKDSREKIADIYQHVLARLDYNSHHCNAQISFRLHVNA
jgi:hypothetical protein